MRRRRRGLLLAIVVTALTAGASAAPKRSLPDYDGRGAPKATAGDVLLWAPRVIAAPFYLVSEYGLRRPLGALTVTAEQNHWSTAFLDFFTFDKEHKAGVLPTAFVDFGFRPSVGLYFFWDDAFARGNVLRLHAATWGVEWLSAAVADRYAIGDRAWFAVHGDATRRSDYIFHGIGPRTLESQRSRYSADRLEAGALLEAGPFAGVRVESEIGVRRVRLREGSCCHEPSVFDRIRAGQMSAPSGFEGYDLAFSRLEISADSRLASQAGAASPAESGGASSGDGSASGGVTPSGSGVRVELRGGPSHLLQRGQGSFVRYGGALGGFWDVTGTRRVLSLSANVSFVDPLAGDTVPVTELEQLGGFGPMRGYRERRLVDRSAVAATLQYEWPIWAWLNGSIQCATGNVFGPRLAGFDAKLLRLSGTIGIRTAGTPDHRFEILTGFGTDPWVDGLKISSFRLMIGATRGF